MLIALKRRFVTLTEGIQELNDLIIVSLYRDIQEPQQEERLTK